MSDIDSTQTATEQPNQQPCQPQWQSLKGVFGCLLAAIADAAPVFAESFFNCINGSEPPTDDGYRPGGRKRCP